MNWCSVWFMERHILCGWGVTTVAAGGVWLSWCCLKAWPQCWLRKPPELTTSELLSAHWLERNTGLHYRNYLISQEFKMGNTYKRRFLMFLGQTNPFANPDGEPVDTVPLNGQFYLPQEQQVKQFVWYRFPMAWHAWLAPYTPFPHLTQIPVTETRLLSWWYVCWAESILHPVGTDTLSF